MKVLIAGATGVIGAPLTRKLIEGSHEVIGITRTAVKASSITKLGARPVVADVMDRDGLLTALNGMRADAVVHALTALKKLPMRHRDMYETDALREAGMANLLAAAQMLGARRVVAESMHIGLSFA